MTKIQEYMGDIYLDKKGKLIIKRYIGYSQFDRSIHLYPVEN